MNIHVSTRARAQPETVFALAAAVEDWPRILPHYRWVRVLSDDGTGRRTVDMAARRDVVSGVGFGFPLHWVAVQTTHPAERRIEFTHVWGITRGMRVTWTIETDGPGVRVGIRHVFQPAWPVPDGLVRQVVGEYFVNGVARRTLRLIAQLAETRTKDA